MSKTKRISIPAAALCILALAAWCLGVFTAQRAGASAEVVSAVWDTGAGISPADLLQAERYAVEDGAEDAPTATLWRETAGESVTDESGDRAAAADVMEVFGDGGDAYPAGILAGNYPARGDTAGCAVDAALASQLWGSPDVVGGAVRYQGRIYTVRAVLEGDAGLMMIQADPNSTGLFPHLLLRFPQGGGEEAAQAYLNQNGFGGAELLDLPFLALCLSALAALPGLLLAAVLLVRLVRRGWRLRYSPVLLLGYLPGVLAAARLALWSVGFPWDIPSRVIPTKWSDFAFWQRLITSISSSVRQALAGGLSRRDTAFWAAALGCLVCALCACALALLAFERVRVRSWRGLALGSLAAMGTVFLLVLALAGRGGLAPGRALWVLPALVLAVDGAVRWHDVYLTPRGGGADGTEEAALRRSIPMSAGSPE